MKKIKHIGVALLAICLWVFANGFWEMAAAPDHYTACQAINWAQEQNEGKFRPDEALALWVLKGIRCD